MREARATFAFERQPAPRNHQPDRAPMRNPENPGDRQPSDGVLQRLVAAAPWGGDESPRGRRPG